MKNASSHSDHRSDSGFDAMLRKAIPRTPLPATFKQNVWRQIESAGEESAAGCIRRCFGAFLLFMARPVPAASAMVITVAAGLCVIDVAFQLLPADLREAMTLFIHEGMSYAEIASVVRCSNKAVETRIYRARQILKEKLNHSLT